MTARHFLGFEASLMKGHIGMEVPLPSRLWSCSELGSGMTHLQQVKQELNDEIAEERLQKQLQEPSRIIPRRICPMDVPVAGAPEGACQSMCPRPLWSSDSAASYLACIRAGPADLRPDMLKVIHVTASPWLRAKRLKVTFLIPFLMLELPQLSLQVPRRAQSLLRQLCRTHTIHGACLNSI